MTDHQVGRKQVKVEFDVIDVDIIRSKTPVQTGELRDGFTIDSTDGNIVNPVKYANAIEFGTTERPGSFMVERSLAEIGDRLAKRIAEQIDRPGIIALPEIVIK